MTPHQLLALIQLIADLRAQIGTQQEEIADLRRQLGEQDDTTTT